LERRRAKAEESTVQLELTLTLPASLVREEVYFSVQPFDDHPPGTESPAQLLCRGPIAAPHGHLLAASYLNSHQGCKQVRAELPSRRTIRWIWRLHGLTALLKRAPYYSGSPLVAKHCRTLRGPAPETLYLIQDNSPGIRAIRNAFP
jgi:hypothetical protein